jgi:hypothetical protein
MTLPSIDVDLLDTMGKAAAAAAGATNSRRIHNKEQQANIRITPPHHTSTLKTGTTATLMVATSTMGTLAGCVPNQAPRTTNMQQGQI